jgi:hypothetical protein
MIEAGKACPLRTGPGAPSSYFRMKELLMISRVCSRADASSAFLSGLN